MRDCWARARFRAAAFVGLVVMAGGASLATAETGTKICAGVVTDQPPQVGGAHLGWAVDVGGTWLVGGAPGVSTVALYNNPKAENPPQTPQQTIRSPGQTGDRFGYSVSISNDWLAVGAPSGDGRIRESGVVYLFQLQRSADGTFLWEQKAKLEAIDAARGAQLGFAVALSGGTLVVGAPYDSDHGTRAGSVYVFELSGGNWTQNAELHANNDGRPFDLFGSSVAIDGSTLVVGASFADHLGEFLNFGAAYVFEKSLGSWSQTKKLVAAEAFRRGNIQFGASVAIRGSLIAAGAPGDDVSGQNAGSAYVFERSGSDWSRIPLTIEDSGPRKQLGTSVDIGNGRIAVGAPFDGEGGRDAGAAYLFKRQDSGWTQELKLLHRKASSAFGQSIVIHENEVFPGGSLYDTESATDAGAIAVCSTEPPPPPPPVILECDKTGPTSVAAGETVTYTIVVKNTGRATATNVKLADPTPEDLTFVRDSGKLCGEGFPCELGPLAPDQSREIKAEFQVPSIATCGEAPDPIVNVATVSADGVVPVTCEAGSTSIQVPTAGDLVCRQTGPASARAGDLITYTVEVSNPGCKAVRNVTLKDPAPHGLVFDGVGPPCAKLPCKLGPLQPKSPVTVDVSFRVLDQCRESVENIVRITGSGGANATCPAIRTTLEDADLALEVSVPASIPGGQVLEIPIRVSNDGPRNVTNVAVQVDIEGAGSVTEIPPGCAADLDTPGRFLCTLEELACGGVAMPTFGVEAPVCTDCDLPPEPIRVTAEVVSGIPDPNLGDNSASVEVPIDCSDVVCLAIEKTASPDPVTLGDELTYTITVENIGSSDADGVTVEDLPSEELANPRWCQGAGCTPTITEPLVTDFDLSAGSSEVFRLRGTASMCGTLSNKASASHLQKTVEAEATTQE